MLLCETLNIRYPIFLSPMAGIGTPELAATVSNAGGLGALGLGASTPQTAKEQILKTQALSDKPFVVNFFCHQSQARDTKKNQAWLSYLSPEFKKLGATPPTTLNCIYGSFLDNNDDYLKVVLETGVKIISFHFGLPKAHQLTALKNANIITMVSVTSPSEAKLACEAGIDVLIAQGIEAGGHRGIFHPKQDAAMTTVELVHALKSAFHLPIVAAGGIMTGQEIRAMLDCGAQAAQLGTAFVQCPESAASDAYRQALFTSPITLISECLSGRPARGIKNAWHSFDTPQRPDTPSYPYTYDAAKQLHALAVAQGHQDYGAFWAGTGACRTRNLSAQALMQTLIDELNT